MECSGKASLAKKSFYLNFMSSCEVSFVLLLQEVMHALLQVQSPSLRFGLLWQMLSKALLRDVFTCKKKMWVQVWIRRGRGESERGFFVAIGRTRQPHR